MARKNEQAPKYRPKPKRSPKPKRAPKRKQREPDDAVVSLARLRANPRRGGRGR